MAKSALSKHKASDMVKWVIVFLLIIGLVATTVTLFVKLDRQTTVTEIGAEQYIIGTLGDSGEKTDGDTSIVTRNAVTTDGLKVEIADDATVSTRCSSCYISAERYRKRRYRVYHVYAL